MFAFLAALAMTLQAKSQAAKDWPQYGGDRAGTKYSRLDQIDRSNVKRLKEAWIFHTEEPLDTSTSLTARDAFECTPLVVRGVMYLSTPSNRIVALNAETGRQLWAYKYSFNPSDHHKYGRHRGVSLWRGARKDDRIIFGTGDGRIVELHALTGTPVEGFGKHGVIDVRVGVADNWPDAIYSLKSPPMVYRNLIIAGAEVPESPAHGPSGAVRAWDVKTGELVWRFDTIPSASNPAKASWQEGSTEDRTGVNVWTSMSVDEKRGIVFLPVSSASTNFYGGDRTGDDLFSDSLVALNASNGRELWHYQTIHHDLWDYDLPSQPVVADIHMRGRDVPAVIQLGKSGFVFVLDRRTGKPLFPVEERPAPSSEVPTEHASPTQPIPTRSEPLSRVSMSADDLNDTTPELKEYCSRLFNILHTNGRYTPFGLRPTLEFPGTTGGAHWGGGAFDPRTGRLFVNVNELGAIGVMEKNVDGSYDKSPINGTFRFAYKELIPCQKPPWGSLVAINLTDGSLQWKVPLGGIEELEEQGIARTGSPNLGGSIVTAGGLVFVAAATDRRLRAFDASSGVELWSAMLPAAGYATPMTYQGPHTHKQYVAIAAGGGGNFPGPVADTLVVFTLPQSSDW